MSTSTSHCQQRCCPNLDRHCVAAVERSTGDQHLRYDNRPKSRNQLRENDVEAPGQRELSVDLSTVASYRPCHIAELRSTWTSAETLRAQARNHSWK